MPLPKFKAFFFEIGLKKPLKCGLVIPVNCENDVDSFKKRRRVNKGGFWAHHRLVANCAILFV